MTRRDAIRTIIDAFQGNPFEQDTTTRRRAAAAIAETDVGTLVSKLLRGGEDDYAKALILAVGHAQAMEGRAAEDILDENVLPASVLRKLPRPRGAYLRICAAAGRAYRILEGIRGRSPQMLQARRATWAACFGGSLREMLDLEPVIREHDVLLLGETGTGKEHFATAMMAASPGDERGNPAPQAAVNAAAIPEALVESELFGHIKGAFTGATESRAGRIRSAHGGAFFLDEVGDLPRPTQVKLLRVIETDEVFPVGSDVSHSADVRYIAATHKDLVALTDEGAFRRDLFERLAGVVIEIPPLRERPEDIAEIGLSFVRRYLDPGTHGQRLMHIEEWLESGEARTYRWPGNVRELQNALRNMILGLPPGLKRGAQVEPPRGETPAAIPRSILDNTAPLASVEDWYILRVLEHNDGNYSQSARILGLDRSTVKRRTSPRTSAGRRK